MSCAQLIAFALLTMTFIPHSIAANADKLLRSKESKRSIVIDQEAFASKMNVRLCNAYTDKSPVAVVLKNDRDEKETDITKHEPLQYKSCKAWPMTLRRGDTLEFQQSGAQLAAFAVTSVPRWDAILLLIIHRKGTSSRPAFTSHVFSKTTNPQVAVLDMYAGPSKKLHSLVIQQEKVSPSNPAVTQEKAHHVSALAENLAYNSVVAVERGDYFCALTGTESSKHAALKTGKVAFKALEGESYVAMRVGNSGNSEFPEELVVFPSSESKSHRTGFLSVTMLVMVLLVHLFN